MFELQCPKCHSTRIHHGYEPAPFYMRMLGFQNLLCNGCNLLFTAFAWPGTIQRQSRRKRRPAKNVADAHAEVQEALAQARTQAETIKGQTAPRLASSLSEKAMDFAAIHLPGKDTPPAKTTAPGLVELPDSAIYIEIDETFREPPPQKIKSPKIKTRRAKAPAGAASEASSIAGAPVTSQLNKPAHSVAPETTPTAVAPARTGAAKTARHKRKESKRSAAVSQRNASIIDYARFGVYYAGLYVKNKFGARKSSHPMEVKFRWRNWWHRERTKAI